MIKQCSFCGKKIHIWQSYITTQSTKDFYMQNFFHKKCYSYFISDKRREILNDALKTLKEIDKTLKEKERDKNEN